MDCLELIQAKRRGEALSEAQLNWLAQGAAADSIPGYQLGALLMAICWQGLSYPEILALARAYSASGEQLVWREADCPVVDKHSTGGVGDKVTLLLAPLGAAAGLWLPKLSGRGLGFTGGTVDKLASIPGMRMDLDSEAMHAVLEAAGCCVTGQSQALAPADKKTYAIRDATDTVMQMGLIAASIMGKKLAAGARNIVLDVKCGSGALFRTLKEAREFAALAIRIGRDCGRNVACVISDMDQPLGSAIGNALEVAEVMALLEGIEPQPRLVELCQTICAVALVLAGKAASLEEAQGRLDELITSGAVGERFERWIQAQGGDLPAFRANFLRLQDYRHVGVRSPAAGYVQSVSAAALGELARDIGAGRRKAEDRIDPLVGIEWFAPVGMRLEAGSLICWLWLRREDVRSGEELAAAVQAALRLSEAPVPVPPVVLDIVW